MTFRLPPGWARRFTSSAVSSTDTFGTALYPTCYPTKERQLDAWHCARLLMDFVGYRLVFLARLQIKHMIAKDNIRQMADLRAATFPLKKYWISLG
jgi:hypothetical protein